ncbi:MAG: tetratricopeptide repeat protein, partial [Myxococcota bacterium]|nr:tetratricopeptide repeat protein [Myxococcota bacterium]
LAGLDAPQVDSLRGDGHSLEPWLHGEEQPARPHAFECVAPALDYGTAPVFGLVDETGQSWFDLPQPELYDLDADPGQTLNLFEGHDPTRGENPSRSVERRWPQAPGTVSEEQTAALEALGYLTAIPVETMVSRIDPKERAEVFHFISLNRQLLPPHLALARAEHLVQDHGRLPALQRFQADLLDALGRHREALQVLRTISEAHPDDVRLQSEVEQREHSRNELETLVRTIAATLAENPEHPTAHYDLAVSLHRLERLDEAEPLYQAVLSETPADDQARVQLSLLLVARDEPERALEILAAALDREDHEPRLDCLAGRILAWRLNRPAAAHQALTRCRELGGELSVFEQALLDGETVAPSAVNEVDPSPALRDKTSSPESP